MLNCRVMVNEGEDSVPVSNYEYADNATLIAQASAPVALLAKGSIKDAAMAISLSKRARSRKYTE